MSENQHILPEVKPNDTNSAGLNLLAFFVPIIGLFLYLGNKGEHPIKAKGIGRSALSGFLLSITIQLLMLMASR